MYIPVNKTTSKYKVGDVIALVNSPEEQLSQCELEVVAIEGNKLIYRDDTKSPDKELLNAEQRFCPK